MENQKGYSGNRTLSRSSAMQNVEVFSSKEDFISFVDNYQGELRIVGRRVYEGKKLVAVRA